jgi:cytochrome c553
MIKEAKNVDFYTTGRQPSEQDFARISAWIKQHRLATAKKRRVNKKRQVKAVVG